MQNVAFIAGFLGKKHASVKQTRSPLQTAGFMISGSRYRVLSHRLREPRHWHHATNVHSSEGQAAVGRIVSRKRRGGFEDEDGPSFLLGPTDGRTDYADI